MSFREDRHKVPPEGTTMRGKRAAKATLSVLETALRWTESDAGVRSLGFAPCLRWSCKADAIVFRYGDARARCKSCDEEYENLGDRARRIGP